MKTSHTLIAALLAVAGTAAFAQTTPPAAVAPATQVQQDNQQIRQDNRDTVTTTVTSATIVPTSARTRPPWLMNAPNAMSPNAAKTAIWPMATSRVLNIGTSSARKTSVRSTPSAATCIRIAVTCTTTSRTATTTSMRATTRPVSATTLPRRCNSCSAQTKRPVRLSRTGRFVMQRCRSIRSRPWSPVPPRGWQGCGRSPMAWRRSDASMQTAARATSTCPAAWTAPPIRAQ